MLCCNWLKLQMRVLPLLLSRYRHLRPVLRRLPCRPVSLLLFHLLLLCLLHFLLIPLSPVLRPSLPWSLYRPLSLPAQHDQPHLLLCLLPRLPSRPSRLPLCLSVCLAERVVSLLFYARLSRCPPSLCQGGRRQFCHDDCITQRRRHTATPDQWFTTFYFCVYHAVRFFPRHERTYTP